MADFTKYLPGARLTNFILLVSLAYLLTIQYCNKRDQDRSNSELAQMIKDQKDTTHVEKNTQGEDVFYRRQVTGSLENMERLLTKDSLDNLAARFNTLSKRIADYAMISSQILSSVPQTESHTEYIKNPNDYADTCREVKYMSARFQSPYDDIHVRLGDSAYLTKKTVDTLELLTARKREGNIFNRRWYTSLKVIGRNPDATYKIDRTWRVEDSKPTRISLVLYGGVGYDPLNFKGFNKPQPQVGIGIGWNILRLK